MAEITNEPGRGQDYWRSLQELADTDEFRHQLDNEFPGGIDAPGGMTRRRFLQIMSASIALTSFAGCRWPVEKIVPFAKRPAGYDPGTPVQFATAFDLGPVAYGVLATSYDGRPIKIDGNPDFALSLGATSALAQASVLDLYDPDRSRRVLARRGRSATETDWAAFAAWARDHFAGLRKGGARVAILTGATTSPSLHALLGRAARTFPDSRVYLWEPVCRDNEVEGLKTAFGRPARTWLDLERADVILDLDANLMQDHPQALRNSRMFARRRRPEHGKMNRLYCWEHGFSITGGMADHRFPTAARDIGPAVWALAAELVLGEGLPLPMGAGVSRGELSAWRGHAAGGPHLAAVARDLMASRGRSLLLAGLRQPREVHALVHTLNVALGNVGHAITYVPVEMPDTGTVEDLARDLEAGRIDTLVVLDSNPVYTAPADLDFAAALGKAKHRIHLAEREDATGKLCTWHLPKAHYLEAWGDATGWDGTYLAAQPLIAPLFDGHTATELLSLMVDDEPRTAWQIARDTFAARVGRRGPAPAADADPAFEKRWQSFIHDGLLKGSGRERGDVLAPSGGRIAAPGAGAEPGEDNLEVVFAHDQSVWDGRFANNAWLQEMPDFMSKLTWDSAAIVSPAAAAALGVGFGDLVTLELKGRSLEAPVYVQPGQARWSVTLPLGYGRTDAGRVALGAGFDAYRLRTTEVRHFATGLKLTRTGRTYPLACTQDHFAIDRRGAEETQKRIPRLVREGTITDYEANGHFVDHLGLHHPPLESLWKERDYTGYKWGMAIDLNACNGCNACLIGCQSENNVAVVGKDEVARGREMAWIRIDRYFHGDPDDPTCAQEPVACAQCELAPCEEVCPVAATMHTREGLNAMVYNRCVGTRYCSNNCPYKVRRFNWFNNFEDLTQTQRLVLNPDVTVRARGVMEKCTYCVQRIEKARVAARVDGDRKIRDGDITPACAQTCPTEAIVFGDLNDPASRVAKLREDSRSYDLLAYLNIKPRTFYMARLRNPNPEIGPVRLHGEDHGGEGHEDGHEEGAGGGHEAPAGQGEAHG